METLSLVLAVIIGLVVGFAGTYFTLVTKLQKKLDSTKSKLGRAKSASEDTETLQFQLEAQKAETQALQARLESLESSHRNQLDELQTAQAAALAQLTAEKTALEDELQSLRESGPAEEQRPLDQSDEVAALQAQLLAMEQEHQARVQALQNQYQAEIESLQQAQPSVEEQEEPLAEEESFDADVAPPAIAEFTEVPGEEFIPAAEPVAEFMEATVTEETPEIAEITPEQEENWVDAPPTAELETEPLDYQGPVGEPMVEEETFSPFDAPPTETTEVEAEADLENWVDAPPEASLPDMDFGGGEENFEPMDLATELPDINDEGITNPGQQLAELSSVETPEAAETEQSSDQFLAELTEEQSAPELPLFSETPAETETLGELEDLGDDLSFTSDSGDDLNLSEDLLASLGTDTPAPELTTEEILPGDGDAEADDLDFLLELQTEETELFPGQNEDEFLPEFSNEEPISAGFVGMETLGEGSGDFPDLLELNPETHGGDPFINILDEDPNSSDNDLLALLQTDEGNANQAELHEDDDLFPGLADMLGEAPSSGSGELDDLDALLSDTSSPGADAVISTSLDDFDFGPDDHDP
ncbi:sll1665 [Synechocystis sp. PCC 6803]|uniref:Sll1665 protein n=1 Tax=Synechocystis sp. (strain ATCC 27184 / PCC 6803 / Kazusa) TaxID=1111708 RepID=P72805_SYNY3|nr:MULTISPECIES: hypothetical protein [unclassified Synechocystis]BAM50527.1 hypothetical protein BEST7613_1596 [Synechocystis sp. PCC 6803] [Bacillus subtilis BEST7613]AGF50509.1 hypothetical protein MYO_12450 [Synechocystis sp. PCC 6803]ALJ66588.1 hypothetical protein AOY38_01250 [Synechocystis sp. PCC 6803]AVP88432.1 hypothetical protein C7I86_01265 [Synechocystis sp. IPPAS B-1465]MBD2617108.1 hypothetical protein [Synechocystis sp. FACHB-898]